VRSDTHGAQMQEFSLFLRHFVLFFRVSPCYNPFEISPGRRVFSISPSRAAQGEHF
jgi:hypothetical protein